LPAIQPVRPLQVRFKLFAVKRVNWRKSSPSKPWNCGSLKKH